MKKLLQKSMVQLVIVVIVLLGIAITSIQTSQLYSSVERLEEKIKEDPFFTGNSVFEVKDTAAVRRYRFEVFCNELLPSEKKIIDSLKATIDYEYWITWDFNDSCYCDSASFFSADHRIFFPSRNKN